jgi:hypothetical protein
MKQKTPAAYELIVHAWWTDAQIYSDHFFEMTDTLQAEATNVDAVMLFHELRMIRDSFEEADYPPCATAARLHLLNSMSRVMLGFEQFLAGNEAAAHESLRTAQRELQHLETALGRMGVPIWHMALRVH